MISFDFLEVDLSLRYSCRKQHWFLAPLVLTGKGKYSMDRIVKQLEQSMLIGREVISFFNGDDMAVAS